VGEWKGPTPTKGKATGPTAKIQRSSMRAHQRTTQKGRRYLGRMKAIAWRKRIRVAGSSGAAKDAKNYYSPAPPARGQHRLSTLSTASEPLIQKVESTHSDGWHTLRVTMTGDKIACYYDDKQYTMQGLNHHRTASSAVAKADASPVQRT